MKVLSIREPYATLIANKTKYIETRSWKTKYRGDIIIHSCKGVYPIKEKIQHLVDKKNLKYGYMLCIATIVDCVYIDEKYAKKIKSENIDNYLCGDYTPGRYAWILDNIRIIKEPIEISGKLGLWNYETKIDINIKR